MTIWWINEHVQKNMPCPYYRRSLMPLVRPRFLILWTWGLATISCHSRRVIRSGQHFGKLTPMRTIICTNGIFCHLVWRMPLQSFKGSWIEFWQVLVLPNATLMTSLFLTYTQEIICTICKRCLKYLKNITLSFIQASVGSFILKWNT